MLAAPTPYVHLSFTDEFTVYYVVNNIEQAEAELAGNTTCRHI